jgi:penicillin-binding protein
MASIYSAFAKKGTMIKPYIEFSNGESKKLKKEIIKTDIADIIKEDLVQIVEKGTAVACKIEGRTIAGKTGTAEIKASQTDKDGTEIGWFDSFDEKGNLIIAMQENVKNIGGSEAVVKKVKNIYLEIGE